MKQINLTFLLAVLMSMAGATASAHDIAVANADGVTIYYNFINDNTELQVTYQGSGSWNADYAGEVVIPEAVTYNGSTYNVTSIGSSAFNDCSSLEKVVIPNSITSIENSVFNGCTTLKQVVFEEGEETIYLGYKTYSSSTGQGLFYDCPLESITLGRTINYTNYSSSYPFSSYPSRYGYSAFYNQKNLTSVTIGDKVTSLPQYILYNCSALASIAIPETVTSIGSSAFKGCTALTALTFNAVNCSDFSSNSSVFPSTISSLTFGDNVTKIPAYFLYDGSKIESLTIPNSVTEIGSYAFYGWNNLKSLTLGSGLISIGSNAFPSTNIAKVFWLGNTPPTNYGAVKAHVNYVANDQYYLSNQMKYQFLSSRFTVNGTMYVPVSPADRTCDVVDCIYDEGITSIEISDKVTNMGVELSVMNVSRYSFYNNKHIQALSLSNDGVVGNDAFNGCSSLETATLGDQISALGNSVFQNCSKLQGIVIPDSVKTLGSSAFSDCI